MTNTSKFGSVINVAKNCPIVPYLIFAIDCMVFCKAHKSAARNVKTILENNCSVSGITSKFS